MEKFGVKSTPAVLIRITSTLIERSFVICLALVNISWYWCHGKAWLKLFWLWNNVFKFITILCEDNTVFVWLENLFNYMVSLSVWDAKGFKFVGFSKSFCECMGENACLFSSYKCFEMITERKVVGKLDDFSVWVTVIQFNMIYVDGREGNSYIFYFRISIRSFTKSLRKSMPSFFGNR